MTEQQRGAVAVLGERVVDLVPEGSPDLLRVVPGGSPANVAVGLARLGVVPVLLARSGDDGFSRVLDRHLVDSGLGLAGVVPAGGPSAVAAVERQPDGSAHYDLYLNGVPDLSWTAADLATALAAADRLGAVCWHTGSLASWSGPGWATVLDAWRAAHDAGALTLSYDPNARPGQEPLPEVARRVEEYVRLSDVVKVSDEDLARLFRNGRRTTCARHGRTPVRRSSCSPGDRTASRRGAPGMTASMWRACASSSATRWEPGTR